MKTAHKIVNNLYISLKDQLIKTNWVIIGNNQFMSKHTFHIQNPSIYTVSIGLATPAHMLNGYIS